MCVSEIRFCLLFCACSFTVRSCFFFLRRECNHVVVVFFFEVLEKKNVMDVNETFLIFMRVLF